MQARHETEGKNVHVEKYQRDNAEHLEALTTDVSIWIGGFEYSRKNERRYDCVRQVPHAVKDYKGQSSPIKWLAMAAPSILLIPH